MRPLLATVLMVSAATTAGCGSTSKPATVPGEDTIRGVMAQWAAASTAGEQCDLFSSGFRFFVGDGDPSRTACIDHADAVFGPPRPGPLIVHTLSVDHDQTLVDASVGDDRTTYYLVPQYDTWKINSIGVRQGLGPTPPPTDVYDG